MRKTLPVSLIFSCSTRKLSCWFFNMLGVVVYCSIEKCGCFDCLSLQREPNFLLSQKKDTSFDDLSGVGILGILLNIVSCYGLFQEKSSTLILTCRSKLVAYYLPKGFVMLNQDFHVLNNLSLNVKKSHTCYKYF